MTSDLKVVLETALTKEQDRRYQTALDLAEDLRRVRETEPILARPVGPFGRYRRWARRRPALAATSTGLLLALVMGVLVSGYLLRESRVSLAESQRLNDIRGLPFVEQTAAEERWPALPEGIPQIDDWLVEAEALYGRLRTHRAYLERLRTKASPAAFTDGKRHWRFEDAETQRKHDNLAAFVDRLSDLSSPIEKMRAKRVDAATIAKRTIDAYHEAWDNTIEAITHDGENPQYHGLRIKAQVGLIPIGQDPDSGLFEFAHPQTGEIPARNPRTGRLQLTEQTGLVFILIPGGAFNMGAEPPSERKPEGSPNVDPHATMQDDERPVHRVELGPFFISKYEMTEGQWLRVTGNNPGRSARTPGEGPHSLLHPVDGVSWLASDRVLARLGLLLPTEAQWEYAARAGTTTVWWTGNDPKSLQGAANLRDSIRLHWYPDPDAVEEWPFDGYSSTAPVGKYRANPFGLHDVHGNIRELVRDWHGSYELPVQPGDGERLVKNGRFRIARGGGHGPTYRARSARRSADLLTDSSLGGPGVRPARPITKEATQRSAEAGHALRQNHPSSILVPG